MGTAEDQLHRVLAAAQQRQAVRARLSDVDAQLVEAAVAAHDAGVPWEQIASLVGMSRQALLKRVGAGV